MERFRQKPSIKEIFYSLTDSSYRDWDDQILERADTEEITKVENILKKGLPFSEAEIEVEDL